MLTAKMRYGPKLFGNNYFQAAVAMLSAMLDLITDKGNLSINTSSNGQKAVYCGRDGPNPTCIALAFFENERPLEYVKLGCGLQVAAARCALTFR